MVYNLPSAATMVSSPTTPTAAVHLTVLAMTVALELNVFTLKMEEERQLHEAIYLFLPEK